MAKIKYSALVSEMRNKLNGSVLSKNRYGNYVRTKVTPVNPQTSYQQAARSILASLSSSWRNLTQSQQLGWTALAKTLPFTDIFGDAKFLTGSALYVKLNTNLLNASQAQLSVAPDPVSLDAFNVVGAVIEQSAGVLDSMDVEISLSSLPANTRLAVYATPVVPSGQNFVKNKMRFIGTVASVTTGVADIQSLYEARFGDAMPNGSRVAIRVALVSTTSGQLGIPNEVWGTAVPV